MNAPAISSIGHVALTTPELEAAIETALSIKGLRLVDRTDAGADLTHGAPHHTIQYISGPEKALHHVGLVATDDIALSSIRERAARHGYEVVSESPLDAALSDGLVISGPDGILFEIYSAMPEEEETGYPTPGVRPERFGHVTLTVSEPARLRDFLTEVLDFRVSDELAGGFFMRCNVDHHGIGIFPGEPGLHHYAWEASSIAELAAIGDRLDQSGSNLLLGPVRHGAGSNIAVYFHDGAGVLTEYYCEMDRIYDEEGYRPAEWNMDEFKWFSRWAPIMPEVWVEYAIGRVEAVGAGL